MTEKPVMPIIKAMKDLPEDVQSFYQYIQDNCHQISDFQIIRFLYRLAFLMGEYPEKKIHIHPPLFSLQDSDRVLTLSYGLGRDTWEVLINRFGLYGAYSPLPSSFTDRLLEYDFEGILEPKAFIDVFQSAFHHDYFRLSFKRSIAIMAIEMEDNRYRDILYKIDGTNRTKRQRFGLDLMKFSPLLRRRVKNIKGLQKLLDAFFESRSIPSEIEIKDQINFDAFLEKDTQNLLGNMAFSDISILGDRLATSQLCLSFNIIFKRFEEFYIFLYQGYITEFIEIIHFYFDIRLRILINFSLPKMPSDFLWEQKHLALGVDSWLIFKNHDELEKTILSAKIEYQADQPNAKALLNQDHNQTQKTRQVTLENPKIKEICTFYIDLDQYLIESDLDLFQTKIKENLKKSKIKPENESEESLKSDINDASGSISFLRSQFEAHVKLDEGPFLYYSNFFEATNRSDDLADNLEESYHLKEDVFQDVNARIKCFLEKYAPVGLATATGVKVGSSEAVESEPEIQAETPIESEQVEESKAETEPEAIVESEAEIQAETPIESEQVEESKAETEPEAIVESEAEIQAETPIESEQVEESKAETEPEAIVESEAEIQAETPIESEQVEESKAETEPEAIVESEAEIQAETPIESEQVEESKAETEPEAIVESEAEIQAETPIESEQVEESKAETEPSSSQTEILNRNDPKISPLNKVIEDDQMNEPVFGTNDYIQHHLKKKEFHGIDQSDMKND